MQSRITQDAPSPRSVVLRQGLPFGVVMATAGASVLAGRCGLQGAVVPLLALGANAAAPWIALLAGACLGLTWLLTLVCVGRFVWSLATRGLSLRKLDGAWFLVPAAVLGAAIATDGVAGRVPAQGAAALAGLALAGALLGWLGYWAVALAALFRVRRFGLGGVPQAPWWIAMGCAGLAAAALGRVVQGPGSGWLLQAFLARAMVVTAVVAAVLCVPVLVYGGAFLLRRCRFRALAPWPPTFSAAVFALGCLETGEALRIPAFRILGLGAGYATLVFWAVTMAWNVGHMGFARLRDREQRGT
ncbi:MAG: hypothetical protein ACREP2_12060 [Rhodanobacteraceae bacterium]